MLCLTCVTSLQIDVLLLPNTDFILIFLLFQEIQSLKERLSETQSKLAEVETEKEEFINLSLTNTISELDSSRDMRSPIPSDVREVGILTAKCCPRKLTT